MNYIIGNYRAKKIDDSYFITTDHGSHIILSEEKFRQLKRNNLDGELTKNLEEREIILTKENISEAIRLLRNRNAHIMQGTSLHIVVVTLRCNMNCIYCHASSKGENEKNLDMDKDTGEKTIDFIFQTTSNDITIEFQGGEPLLNWDVIKHMTDYAKKKNEIAKKNLQITLVTNFSKMDDDKLSYMIEKDMLISTSLDGPKALHDSNRIYVKGSNHEQVTYWLGRIAEEYKKKSMTHREVGALVTLTKESLNYPKEIIDEYVRLGLRKIHLRFLNNLGIAKQSWSHIMYSAEEYMDFWKKSVEYVEELNKKGIDIGERMVEIMTHKMLNEYDPNYLDLRSPCGAATGQLVYNYDGKIYTCDEARMIGDDLFLLGNVQEDNYKDIVTSDKACAVTAASINDQYVCNDCAYKPYCGICPVCNYAEQGSVIGKIPQTDRCKIYMYQFDWIVKNKIIKSKK